MTKAIINAKDALQDILSGLDNASLMDKYKLAPQGLRSLYNKLLGAGLLQNLNNEKIENDVQSSESEELVQEKYVLSPKGLNILYKALKQSGLMVPTNLQTSDQSKITVKVDDIVKDIRSGMSSTELIQKHSLTKRGFQWICIQLVSGGILGCDEVYEDLFQSDGSLVIESVRSDKRLRIINNNKICELSNRENEGTIEDVSSKGLRTSGLKAKVDEIKTLMIPKDYYGEFGKMVFEAKCRWTKIGRGGSVLAGFEVIDMSPGMLEEFKLFYQTSTSLTD